VATPAQDGPSRGSSPSFVRQSLCRLWPAPSRRAPLTAAPLRARRVEPKRHRAAFTPPLKRRHPISSSPLTHSKLTRIKTPPPSASSPTPYRLPVPIKCAPRLCLSTPRSLLPSFPHLRALSRSTPITTTASCSLSSPSVSVASHSPMRTKTAPPRRVVAPGRPHSGEHPPCARVRSTVHSVHRLWTRSTGYGPGPRPFYSKINQNSVKSRHFAQNPLSL
jgi:hypothetical protein